MTLTPADASFLAALSADLPDDVFREVAPRYVTEPYGRGTGVSGPVLAPANAEQVSTIIRAAGQSRVGVIPYGGGTGLVGGQMAFDGPAPVILSLERLNAIRALYPEENVIEVEAGVILADMQAAAEEAGRLFPLSLAAEGSATIGGNLATNAGGVNVLRYGNTRDLCLGLEAVLPDGSIWNGLTRLRKDNTGYDLRNLLIGAEGTLGVITAATMKLFPRPDTMGTAFLVVPSAKAAVDLLSLARNRVGDSISAFELIHRQGLDFLAETLPAVRQPFAEMPEWSVLIELGLFQRLDPVETLESLFAEAAEEGLVLDGLIAQSESQRNDFWAVREHIPEANRLIGAISSHDLSIPSGSIAEFVLRAREQVAELGTFRINCFGHVGDGNLHFNVFPMAGRTRDDHAHQQSEIKQTIHDLVHEMNGSISAEHGVGRFKAKDLERYASPAKLDAMRLIKRALDPAGIMNPGAVLRSVQ